MDSPVVLQKISYLEGRMSRVAGSHLFKSLGVFLNECHGLSFVEIRRLQILQG